MAYSWIHILLMFLLAPLLVGVITRVKAVIAGRHGQPVLQLYFDLWKLMHKGAAISRTTTWLFPFGPAATIAAAMAAAILMPCGGISALISFPGDLVLFAYLFGLARFVTILAALDTGSSFEGMGASREAAFSALAEPVLLLALAALARLAQSSSLSGIFGAAGATLWSSSGATLTLAIAAMFVVMLAENSRIPVDDPTTHLELTMIHEVMVLDHGGPDLALITWSASLKLWLFASLIAGAALPALGASPAAALALHVAGVFSLGIAVGLVESMMARLKLVRVPQLLTGAIALAMLALILSFLMR
ncbi:MAG: NADH-quinone oxidoreductase subunit H [bacterium]